MSTQLSFMDLLERELMYSELQDHVGERLHYYVAKNDVLDKDDLRDERVLLLTAEYQDNGWLKVVLQPEDDKDHCYTWICNPTNDLHGARTHLFTLVEGK